MMTVFVGLLLGCTPKRATCELDSECASGVCAPSGECVVLRDTADTGSSSDTADTTDTTDTTDSSVCQPNHDGLLERGEYPSVSDLRVPFLYSENTSVQLTPNNGVWDFSTAVNGEEVVYVETMDPTGFWFAESFPNSSYVTVLSHQNELYGIFTLSEDALTLDGVASFDEGWDETLLVYDPPAMLYQFPMQEGQSWSTESTVTGTLNGVYSYHIEEQLMTVDNSGILSTTLGQFPVLRVHSSTLRTVGIFEYTSQNMSFVSECYGVVVTASSELDETQPEFDTAFELLRMAP